MMHGQKNIKISECYFMSHIE